MSDQTKSNPLDKGTALALRWITKLGGHPSMQDADKRNRVSKIIFASTRQGLRTESQVRRVFAKVSTNGSKPTRAKTGTPRPVFDLTPTDDQQMIQEAARELASQVLRPAALDADTNRAVPDSVKEQALELGLALIGVPDELGGIAEERSAVTAVLAIEAPLARRHRPDDRPDGTGRCRLGDRALRQRQPAGHVPAGLH